MLRYLDHLEEWFISSLIAAATLLIFVSVVQRYAATVPALYPWVGRIDLSWAQELCIFMFVWMAKFGAAYGVRQGIHVGVDVLVNKLRPKARARMIVISLCCGMLFTGIIAGLGAVFVWRIHATGQVSPDLEIPKWIVYLAIPLGSSLMCFRFVQVLWNFVHTGALPHADHTHVEGLEDINPAELELYK